MQCQGNINKSLNSTCQVNLARIDWDGAVSVIVAHGSKMAYEKVVILRWIKFLKILKIFEKVDSPKSQWVLHQNLSVEFMFLKLFDWLQKGSGIEPFL